MLELYAGQCCSALFIWMQVLDVPLIKLYAAIYNHYLEFKIECLMTSFGVNLRYLTATIN